MQSTAIPLCPPPFLKPPNRNSNSRFIPLHHSPSPTQFDLTSIHGVSCHRITSSPCSASSINTTRTSVSFLVSNGRYNDVKVRAASVPGSADETAKSNSLARTLQLGSLFGLWYLLNIHYNIYNKQVLKVYPFSATVTAFQFGCGTVIVTFMWAFKLYARPKISRSQLLAILPLAAAHTLGNLLTNISLGKLAVSFTHTIKSMEPFFTVVLSALVLGEGMRGHHFHITASQVLDLHLPILYTQSPTLWVVSSLVPIVGGVALASSTETSFNWTGFCSAMASNLVNQSRNVLSKKVLVKKEEGLDNINLFSVITIISFITFVPIAIFMDGIKFTPSYLQSAASQGLNIRELCVRSLLAGLCFYGYQQVSYMILQVVSPMTHAVGNCVKRVVVIVSSVIFFQTPVSLINFLGTGLALAGVFLYSRAKRIKPTSKAA